MSDRDAFIGAVIANPADDLPRTVFADWLDEHGDPKRAEFIRVQCELAAIPGDDPHGRCEHSCGVTACRRPALRLRESWVWAGPHHGSDSVHKWFTRQPHLGGMVVGISDATRPSPPETGLAAVVRRGFVSEVRGPLAAFWEDRACGHCLGEGEFARYPNGQERIVRCRLCTDGRITGPAPAFAELVRREPVERVGVTDRRPHPRLTAGYTWWDVSHIGTVSVDDTSNLPPAIIDRMAELRLTNLMTFDRRVRWLRFDTEVNAVAALSAALIAAGRGLST